jgi:hypothetical protein
MPFEYGIYEYKKEPLAKMGDFDQWLYRVKNTETGNTFAYKIAISSSALASGDLPEDIQLTVNSKGVYLIKTWLDKNLETKIQALVLQQHIESKTLSVKDEWIDWKDF